MSLTRTTVHTIIFAAAALTVACGTSTPTTGSTESALVVTPADDAKSITLTSDGDACGLVSTLIDAHITDLQTLCGKPGQLPMPSTVSSTGCETGSVISITFTCVAANLPPVPEQGCRKIEVKDDHNAISASGREQIAALPPVLCPLLHGAPPPAGPAGGPPPPPDGGPPSPPSPPSPPHPDADAGPPPPPPLNGGPAAPPPAPPADGSQPPTGGPSAPPPPPPPVECCAPPPPPADGPKPPPAP